MEEELRPDQTAVPDCREHQTPCHAQDALTSVPAQHEESQQEHGRRLGARGQERGRGDGKPQVEVGGRGQKERHEGEEENTGLVESGVERRGLT